MSTEDEQAIVAECRALADTLRAHHARIRELSGSNVIVDINVDGRVQVDICNLSLVRRLGGVPTSGWYGGDIGREAQRNVGVTLADHLYVGWVERPSEVTP